jgi:hypothetical protein
VPATSIGVDHDRIGGIEGRVIRRPSIAKDFDLCGWDGFLDRVG